MILDQTGDPAVDLADEQQVRAAAAAVLDQHGQCDVLVHTAGRVRPGRPRQRVDLAGWRRVQAVNVESALLLAQAFVPGMAARGFGRIIFVVSDTIWAPADRGERADATAQPLPRALPSTPKTTRRMTSRVIDCMLAAARTACPPASERFRPA